MPVDGERLSLLSERQGQVMRLLAAGMTVAQMARRLGLRPVTVRNHIMGVLRKLGVHGRREAVALAYRSGWVPRNRAPRKSDLTRLASLSPREAEVLRLVTEGRSLREASSRMGIAQVTVRNHVQALLPKLGVHSMLQAVVLGHRAGWVRLRRGKGGAHRTNSSA